MDEAIQIEINTEPIPSYPASAFAATASEKPTTVDDGFGAGYGPKSQVDFVGSDRCGHHPSFVFHSADLGSFE